MPPAPRILVVEDDRIYAELLAGLLRVGGYEVDMVGTLWDAEKRAMTDYVAITLDLNLPDSVGQVAILQLRPLYPNAAIVVVSSYVTDQDVMRMIRAGADDCICKPVRNGSLVAVVKRAIELRDQRKANSLLQAAYDKLAAYLPPIFTDTQKKSPSTHH